MNPKWPAVFAMTFFVLDGIVRLVDDWDSSSALWVAVCCIGMVGWVALTIKLARSRVVCE